MITADEDIALVVEKLRAHFGGYSDREPAIAKEILDALSGRSLARERSYLTFAQTGWSSVKALAVAYQAPSSERAAVEALTRIEARLKQLEKPAESVEFDAPDYKGEYVSSEAGGVYVLCYRSGPTPNGPWSLWMPMPLVGAVGEKNKDDLKFAEGSGREPTGEYFQRAVQRYTVSFA